MDAALLDRVTKWAGEHPAFWARYLGSGGGAATPLSSVEAAFLVARGVGIALVFNDVDKSLLATAAQGMAAAVQALALAKALGVPAEVTLYADIEAGWPLTSSWLKGWIQGLLSEGRPPGAYIGFADVVHIAAVHGLRVKEPGLVAHLSLWDANWLANTWPAASGKITLPPWIRASPSEDALELGLWQFAGPSCAGAVDLNLLDPAASPAPVLWTGQKGV